MSILIMFPASSLQKTEEDFLAAVEDYCDERMVRRLDDGSHDERPEDLVIQEAVAREMAVHHDALRGWLDRLGQIGETLTSHVVTGWEKIDEQLRVRQDQQMDRLSHWASDRQREASDELGETQRTLLRDFRGSLEGMAAEARRIQEEGAHRLDAQLAGIERLHRRLQEEQQGSAEAHRTQAQAVTAAGDQLARTLGRVRGEVAEVRDEGARQLGELVTQLGEVPRTAQEFQRELSEAQEDQARTLRDSADRLAATLQRVDDQLERTREANASHVAAGSEQIESQDRAREQRLRAEAELRDAQLDALRGTSEELSRTLDALRAEAQSARAGLSEALGALAPELARSAEAIARDLAAPLRRELAQRDRDLEPAERTDTEGEGEGGDDANPSGGARKRRLFRKG